MGILHWQVAGAPVAAVDVETTGLHPGSDRIIEVSVVHLDPGREPQLVFDTLVDPQRDPTAWNEHGITRAELQGAPTFLDIARPLVESLAGRILVAHNGIFDLRFLRAELDLLGLRLTVPWACTMFLSPFLGLGRKGSLSATCDALGVPGPERAHAACEDALAAARLFDCYRNYASEGGFRSFSDFVAHAGENPPRYMQSWTLDPLNAAWASRLSPGRVEPRRRTSRLLGSGSLRENYTTAVLEAVADFYVSEEETERLRQIREEQGLTIEEMRAIHVGVFTWMMSLAASDGYVDDLDRSQLQALHDGLGRIGWAPGT